MSVIITFRQAGKSQTTPLRLTDGKHQACILVSFKFRKYEMHSCEQQELN